MMIHYIENFLGYSNKFRLQKTCPDDTSLRVLIGCVGSFLTSRDGRRRKN